MYLAYAVCVYVYLCVCLCYRKVFNCLTVGIPRCFIDYLATRLRSWLMYCRPRRTDTV
jgi:hypothetical protein